MGISVRQLSPLDDGAMINFLDELGQESPSVLGYHYPFYRDVLESAGIGEPIYLGAYSENALVGYLPAFSRDSEVGAVWGSLPFFGPNAGVLCHKGQERHAIHSALVRGLLERAGQAGALSCSIYTPFAFDEFSMYDEAMPEAIVVEKFTQYLDLSAVEWQSSLRRNLQKAQRSNIEVSTEATSEKIDTFYSLYEQNCRERSIPVKPKRAVELLLTEGSAGRKIGVYFAYHEGIMIAGLLVIFSPLTVSYYIPCVLAEARTLQPLPLLIDQAIQDARQRGNRYWNWESSPSRESGVYRFKEKWGSVEGRYRVYVQALCPGEVLKELGAKRISECFPFYFVYPFDRL
ncbi:MAG: GNAT family N-acetyltransferase [Terriglobia bacterium]